MSKPKLLDQEHYSDCISANLGRNLLFFRWHK